MYTKNFNRRRSRTQGLKMLVYRLQLSQMEISARCVTEVVRS